MSVQIKKGSVLVYRIFDIAEEIQIPKVEALLKDIRGRDTFKVPKFIDRGIVVKSPPVVFGLGEVELTLEGSRHQVSVIGKVRDYGVLSLVYQIPLAPGTTWTELVELAADLEEGSEIDQIARAQAREVLELITPALKSPNQSDVFEDYIIYFLEEFEGGVTARDLTQRADIPALLLAEDDTELSQAQRSQILDNRFQYGAEDLAFVEWNSALVVDPGGGREIPDILDFASTHLLEMRYYDDLLEVRTEIANVGGARVGFSYEVRREGTDGPLATGTTEHAAVDSSGRPCRLPESLRRRLA